ncbi:MAG: hydantoinase/oxoprolinase family protein [Lautropia sp.]
MDRLGIDIGGTFTDFVLISPEGGATITKVLSDQGNLRSVISSGLGQLAAMRGVTPGQLLDGIDLVVHGTTIATNALIQRRLAKVGLIGTHGFRDILGLREGFKEDVFDYFLPPVEPIVPRRLSLTVRERVDRDGRIVVPLHEDDVAAAVQFFKSEGVEAVAVGLLWSVVNDTHERRIGELLANALPGMPVFLSSAVSPALREYPRISTAALCAALAGRLETYLCDLESNLRAAGYAGAIRYIQCNGGTTSGDLLRVRPVLALDSGPAAGPVAGLHFARRLGSENVVTLDMGGTSLDVSLVSDGRIETVKNLFVHRHCVSVPMVRVHTIGAGGGSIAWVDGAGLLKVGPQSAESIPGPACYRRGGELPTVTDANVVLGYFNGRALLGGAMPIDRSLAERAIERKLGAPLKIGTYEAAHAVHAIVNENMAHAVRQMSTERGFDVRDFVFVCGGGCSAAHAAGIAGILGVDRVLVPRVSSVLCAFGAAISDVRHDYIRMSPGSLGSIDTQRVRSLFQEMEEAARSDLAIEGFGPQQTRVLRTMDVRYQGEVSDLTVDISDVDLSAGAPAEIAARFHRIHEQAYTFSDPQSECEVMSVGLAATGVRVGDRAVRAAPIRVSPPADSSGRLPNPTEYRDAWFDMRKLRVPVFRENLAGPDIRIAGPAVVEESTTTIVVPPGWEISQIDPEAWLLTRRMA